MTAQFSAFSDSRSELRELLKQNAILYSTLSEPITHRNGEISPWAFYSWHITLTQRGLRLAARELLAALQTFRSTQLASYGYTGLPLLSACVLEGGGRYTGLSIREKRKSYLTNRRIDGVIDHSRSVVVIDDSLSAGTSLYKAITALEEEGLEVEGVIALVHFPYRGAKKWANTAGYRAVTLFDIWKDLEMAKTENDQKTRPYRFPISQTRLADGLTPTELARQTAEFFLQTGEAPMPPSVLDRDYDAQGGTFVSFRRLSDDYRVARDGYWHFDPAEANPAQDVVFATSATLERAGAEIRLDSLKDFKIAVTFFGRLEAVPPSKLDFDKYGIIVRSRVWPDKLGGALPNTQVFISETEQYRHARKTNARIDDEEPHTLYRHTIQKVIQRGVDWLPYGCEERPPTAWWRNERIGKKLTEHARQVLACLSGTTSISPQSPQFQGNDLVPVAIEGVVVTLYANGLCGYGIAFDADITRSAAAAAEAAWKDKRYSSTRTASLENMTVAVWVLHHGEPLGDAPLSMVAKKLRRGLDALTLAQDMRRTTLLPSALVYNMWSEDQFVNATVALAGGLYSGHSWRTHQVAAWVSGKKQVLPIRFGFPVHKDSIDDAESCAAYIDLLAGYIYRSIGSNLLPAYYLAPSHSGYVRQGTAGRVVHALYTLGLAGEFRQRDDWKEAAAKGVAKCLECVHNGQINIPDHMGGPLADSVLLAAAAASGFAHTQVCQKIAQRVLRLIHASGWIGEGTKRLGNPQDQEFLPGAAVWGIATFCKITGCSLPGSVPSACHFYGHRLREYPTWGCSWLAQAWSVVHEVNDDLAAQAIVFAAADWAAERQLEKNGAFLEDLSPDEPSFNTGFVAEGIAAAWKVALASRNEEAARRYEKCWFKAVKFMTTLTYHPEDVFCFQDPHLAVGGVRCTTSRADIRIDQVSHILHALVDGYAILAANTGRSS